MYSNQRVHKIDSNFLVGNSFKLLPCTSCLTNEKRLYASIMDTISKRYADLIEQRVHFEIPVNDMGDADFTARMDAKLLCRWLINN